MRVCSLTFVEFFATFSDFKVQNYWFPHKPEQLIHDTGQNQCVVSENLFFMGCSRTHKQVVYSSTSQAEIPLNCPFWALSQKVNLSYPGLSYLLSTGL